MKEALKEFAVKNGVEVKHQWGKKKIREELARWEIDIPENLQEDPGKATNSKAGPEKPAKETSANVGKNDGEYKGALDKLKKSYKECFSRAKDDMTKKFIIVKDEPALEEWRSRCVGALVKFKEEGDMQTFIAAAKFLRSKNELPTESEYELNRLEGLNCNKQCKCIGTNIPACIPAQLNEHYPYYENFEEITQRNIFVTFVPRIIPGDQQMSEELASKLRNGFHPKEEDYAKTKKLWRRVVLSELEWLKLFKDVGATTAKEWFA